MWEWRPEVLLPLSLVAAAGGVGWWRLSLRGARPLPLRRAVLMLSGLAAVALALVSPIASGAHARFSVHMVQHVLLMMVAPPLVMMADPLPAILWALPKSIRVPVGRVLAPGAVLRRLWQGLTWPPAAWLGSTLALWLWHLPGAYEAALNDDVLHDVEHLVLFGAGILFWWPLIGPAPRVRGLLPYSLRLVYLVPAGGQQALLGLLLSTSPVVLYPSYQTSPSSWGLSPLDDQARGGVIMWAAGGIIGLVTLMVLMCRLLEVEEKGDEPRDERRPAPSAAGSRRQS